MRTLATLSIFTASALIAAPGFHLDYATYLGGSSDDFPSAIAVDPSGRAYLTGTTSSPDFPLTSTAFGVPSTDHSCAFVTKLNPAGTHALWSICMAESSGIGIAAGSDGSAYVLAGTTNGAVVSKFSPAGDKIVYSKKLAVSPTALAVDAQGSVYLTGSTGPGLTTTQGAYQSQLHSGMCAGGRTTAPPSLCPDAFVIKLRPDGEIDYATYLGGSGPDVARSVAVDSQGDAWVTGDTASPYFPTTPGALESAFQGEVDLGPLQFGDAFVAKLNPTGTGLLYSTYLGGKSPDSGFGIAVDTAGAAYVTGATQSADFPTTPGAFQRTYGGGNPIPASAGDAFVTKFNPAGAVVYSTYMGGPQDERATVIAVDTEGKAYINTYPNTSTSNPNTLSILNSSGSAIINSAQVSGTFAMDQAGALYFTRSTLADLFFPTQGAFQTAFGGGAYDASAVKIDFIATPSPWITNIVNAAGLRSGTPSYYPVFDVAPGEIITIFGSGFTSDTRIQFDGIVAPILYTSNNQINAVVPFEIEGPATAITMQNSGLTLGPGLMNVFDAVPALFTLDSSGKGQAAVLNQDGTVNSPSNPASPGSVIAVFVTGAGRMIPNQPDGSLGPLIPPFPVPVLRVGSSAGQVLYAGAAPGLVAGAVQVNVRLAPDLTSGDRVPIVIYIGNYASGFMGDTTIAIR